MAYFRSMPHLLLSVSFAFRRNAVLLLFLLVGGATAAPELRAQQAWTLPQAAPSPEEAGTAYRDTVPEGYYRLRPVDPNPELLSPEAYFGFAPGQIHLSHDQLLAYFRYLDAASDRVRLMPYGRSWEQRILLVALISAPANLSDAALARTREAQQALTRPAAPASALPDGQGTPLVLYQGCSVHGNEASGANAAVQYAWQLVSSRNADVEALLEGNLILLDPALNPDGIQRFAGWVNMHRGLDPDPGADAREHNESWPGGRTNHYWFDLNRDWLPLTQPESRGRVALFYDWMPQVVTDHHEMGRNSSFFFQPGIPSRTNPLTPARNQELTAELGRFHARALDAIGSTYYSRESFDDFYYGKGSTFPDVNGSVGILFEQASARGHRQQGSNGSLDFAFAIRNQLATLWSTLEGANALSGELRAHTRRFFSEGLQAGREQSGGYAFGSSADPARDRAFLERLIAHRLEVYPIQSKTETNGMLLEPGASWYVPRAQARSRMVDALFARTRSMPDSLFYDVSAWTLPLAWGLPAVAWTGKAPDTGSVMRKLPALADWMNMQNGQPGQQAHAPDAAYAYLIHWPDQAAPALASELLRDDHVLKVATKGFRQKAFGPIGTKQSDADAREMDFRPGTLVLRTARQPGQPEQLARRMQQAAAQGLRIWGVQSGQSLEGIDLGSPSLEALQTPSVAILVGPGANAYDAGSIWQELDLAGQVRPTLLPLEDADARRRLDRFNTIILPHGYYGSAPDRFWEALEQWVREGGHLIAVRNATSYLAQRGWAGLQKAKEAPEAGTAPLPYAEADRRNGARYLGGAIFRARGDWTHPLLYGFSPLRPAGTSTAQAPSGEPDPTQHAAVFLQSSAPFGIKPHAYAAPLRLAPEDPLLSGYAHPGSLDQWAEAPLLYAGRMGRGQITAFAFSPTFRAFWRNTARLLHNAVFFGPVLDGNSLGSEEDAHYNGDAQEHGGHGH